MSSTVPTESAPVAEHGPRRRGRGGHSNRGPRKEGTSEASAASAAPASENTTAATNNSADGAAPAARRPRAPRKPKAAAENGAAGDAAPAAPAAARTPAVPVPNEVFLRNLAPTSTKEEVTALAAPFGTVTSVRLIRRGKTAPMHAEVAFETEANAAAAIAGLNGKAVGESTLSAVVYEKRTRAPAAKKEKAPAAPAAAPADGATTAGGRPPRVRKPKTDAAAATPAAPAAPKPANPLEVYVGNVPAETKEEDITSFFVGHGAVTHVAFRKGAAFVTFDTAEHAAGAVAALNGKELKGAAVRVEARKPRPARAAAAPAAAAAGAAGAAAPKRERKPRGPKPEANADPLKVWVGKLPEAYDVTKLSTEFKGVRKIDQHDTYAYLTFDKEESVQAALDQEAPTFGTTKAVVQRAKF